MAAKKKPVKEGSGRSSAGRPTSYKPEYAEWGLKMAKLGATDKDLAEAFEVTEATINLWKQRHPEFFESIKRGKQFADAEVASKLFHRATGYEHEEDDIRTVTLPGINAGSEIVVTPTIKRYPPDTTAAIFWLKNRQPKVWRDKVETEVTANVTHLYDTDQAKRMAEMLLKKGKD